jgi:hypothetical protein
LQEVFGFDSFRPLQEQAVDKILAGEDVLLRKHALTYTRSINRMLKITENVMILVISLESNQNVTRSI